MDVHCSTCREPWDVYHLWHEVIFEIGLSMEAAEQWRTLPRVRKLSEEYRVQFRAAGWEFGQSIINVIRCPACPPGSQPNPEQEAIKSALEDLLGDDEDGLAATLEDFGL